MSGRMLFKLLPVCLATALVAGGMPAVVAGGFGFVVERPSTRTDLRLKETVLLVRPVGCHGPGASVTATAEGLVRGRRYSVPLKLAPVGVDTYAIQRQWPADGVWLLALSATARVPAASPHSAPITCEAIVELGPNGSVPTVSVPGGDNQRQLPVRYIGGDRRRQEIATALQALNGRASADTR